VGSHLTLFSYTASSKTYKGEKNMKFVPSRTIVNTSLVFDRFYINEKKLKTPASDDHWTHSHLPLICLLIQ
jgi:hypothetical protein